MNNDENNIDTIDPTTEEHLLTIFSDRLKAIAIAEQWKGSKGDIISYLGAVYRQEDLAPIVVGDSTWLNLGESVIGCLAPLVHCKVIGTNLPLISHVDFPPLDRLG